VTGNASTASALAADPANCASSGLAGGITAAGVAEACVTPNAGTNIANDLEEEVTEGSLADSTIVSADIKDGTIASADMASPFNFSGNVGVGSAAPRAVLDVVGNGYLSGTVAIGTGSVTNNLSVTGNVGIGTTDLSQKLNVQGAGRFIGTGNVGIGSTAPGAKLDVYGDIKATGTGVTYFASNVGIGTSAAAKELEVIGNVGIGTTTWATGKTVYVNYNVGVGSSVPARLLDVGGSIEVDTYIYTSTHYCYTSGTAFVCATR
jgi:hypothetical protein